MFPRFRFRFPAYGRKIPCERLKESAASTDTPTARMIVISFHLAVLYKIHKHIIVENYSKTLNLCIIDVVGLMLTDKKTNYVSRQ